ncbi:MAG: GldG family protein [Myxococcales bacterium]|nr:GldG family protein [Myxococcales bacterium]
MSRHGESGDAAAGARSEPRAKRRRALSRLNVGLAGALAIVIVAMVNYLAFRHYARWDWTAQRLFTLSPRSVEVVRGLDRDVDVYLFLSKDEPSYVELDELVQRYRADSPHIHVHQVDPVRQPGQYQTLAARFNVHTISTPDAPKADVAAVVAAGDRSWKITRGDLLKLDFTTLDDRDGPKVDVQAEGALTGAIIHVTSGHKPVVCVTRGHGEWSLDGGQRGLGGIVDTLERDNVEVRSIELRGQDPIDPSCNAVFVLGPQRVFSPAEADLLDRYARDGGNVLLALDPLLDKDQVAPTGLEHFAFERGARIDRDVVVELDPQRLLTTNPVNEFLVTDFGKHPIVDGVRVRGGVLAVSVVRSVRPVPGSGAVSLFETSDAAYGAVDLGPLSQTTAGAGAAKELAAGPKDLAGPLSLAVAVQQRAGADDGGAGARSAADDTAQATSRLVIVGDSDWLRPDLIGQAQFANVDFLEATVGWLAERTELIAVPARKANVQAVVMTRADLDAVLFRVLVLLPLSVLLLGGAVWWSRRT